MPLLQNALIDSSIALSPANHNDYLRTETYDYNIGSTKSLDLSELPGPGCTKTRPSRFTAKVADRRSASLVQLSPEYALTVRIVCLFVSLFNV